MNNKAIWLIVAWCMASIGNALGGVVASPAVRGELAECVKYDAAEKTIHNACPDYINVGIYSVDGEASGLETMSPNHKVEISYYENKRGLGNFYFQTHCCDGDAFENWDGDPTCRRSFAQIQKAVESASQDQPPPLKTTSVGRSRRQAEKATVVSIINVPISTYLEVTQDNQTRWLTASPMAAEKGDVIQFYSIRTMTDFYSKALNRTFPSITLVNQVGIVSDNDQPPHLKTTTVGRSQQQAENSTTTSKQYENLSHCLKVVHRGGSSFMHNRCTKKINYTYCALGGSKKSIFDCGHSPHELTDIGMVYGEGGWEVSPGAYEMMGVGTDKNIRLFGCEYPGSAFLTSYDPPKGVCR